MTVGFIFTSLSFICAAIIEYFVVLYPNKVNVAFQIPQYFILCIAEILVSITGYEFSYVEAPKTMKRYFLIIHQV